MATADRRDTVIFVSVPAAFGGSNRALATLLASVQDRVLRVLASPRDGAFLALARKQGLFEEHLPLPYGSRLRRVQASLRIAAWVFTHRHRLLAIHANASRGLNLAALAGYMSRVPVTAWIHDPTDTPWGRRLGPLLRPLVRDVRWFAVSNTARDVVVGNGLCHSHQVEILPNPLDPGAVLGRGRRTSSARVVVGYLGSGRHRKGFDLLPDIILRADSPEVEWRLFTRRADSDYATPVWQRLDAINSAKVTDPGPDRDVRSVYEQCDIVLVTSREESFSMVTAEAMLNGIPVVASDLEPIRDLLGGQPHAAGLLFPVGDVGAATEAIRRLATDPDLRRRLGDEGRRRASQFRPDRVAARLLLSYGLSEG
jgi:glycosyltransferase involved in cell wall biosynthesis